ncbi:MAG: integrase/recombinase XerD [Chloroflexia bacterium]|jgi:integrase/recombinase XerD|nr:integrase/recombinase XerD [Chloroflexia bacterium]
MDKQGVRGQVVRVSEEDERRAKAEAIAGRPVQAELFTISARGELMQPVADIPALGPTSSLDVARWWFKRHLEQQKRPINTIDSYMYDLALFQSSLGNKTLDRIEKTDLANFLGQANNKSTRKRRLTSLQGLYRYLVNKEKVLEKNPADSFFPDYIPLKTPQVLFPTEQEAILEAARSENSRTTLIVYLLLKLGLTRTELLALKVDHVDAGDPEQPVVYIYYDDIRSQKKERKLGANLEFTEAFQAYVAEFEPVSRLFNLLPQSVNKMVDRVAEEAGITKRVTPQSLRDTFAVEQAKAGADEKKLLLILGLAPDSRNRKSVQRYIKLAAPPVAGVV